MPARVPDEGSPADPDTLVVNPGAGGPPLFCLSALFAEPWPLRALGRAMAEIPVRILSPPGQDWGQAGIRSVEEMAAHYADRIGRIQPQGPIRLLGHCFGATLAHATAAVLEARGRSLEALVMLDGYALTTLPIGGRPGLERVAHSVARAPHLAARAGIAEAHLAARAHYVARQPVEVAIDLVFALGTVTSVRRDRRLAWTELTRSAVRIHPIEGHHDDVLGAQLGAVVRILRDLMGPRREPGMTRQEVEPLLAATRLVRGPVPALADPDGTPWPVVDPTGAGFVETVEASAGRLFLAGWARDPAEPDTPVRVLFFMEDLVAGEARPGPAPRPDLSAVLGIPDGTVASFEGHVDLVPEDRSEVRPLRVFAVGRTRAYELPCLSASPWAACHRRPAGPLRRWLAELRGAWRRSRG